MSRLAWTSLTAAVKTRCAEWTLSIASVIHWRAPSHSWLMIAFVTELPMVLANVGKSTFIGHTFDVWFGLKVNTKSCKNIELVTLFNHSTTFKHCKLFQCLTKPQSVQHWSWMSIFDRGSDWQPTSASFLSGSRRDCWWIICWCKFRIFYVVFVCVTELI